MCQRQVAGGSNHALRLISPPAPRVTRAREGADRDAPVVLVFERRQRRVVGGGQRQAGAAVAALHQRLGGVGIGHSADRACSCQAGASHPSLASGAVQLGHAAASLVPAALPLHPRCGVVWQPFTGSDHPGDKGHLGGMAGQQRACVGTAVSRSSSPRARRCRGRHPRQPGQRAARPRSTSGIRLPGTAGDHPCHAKTFLAAKGRSQQPTDVPSSSQEAAKGGVSGPDLQQRNAQGRALRWVGACGVEVGRDQNQNHDNETTPRQNRGAPDTSTQQHPRAAACQGLPGGIPRAASLV